MSTSLVPIQDIERMALAVSKSGLFGMKTIEQAVALMLVAASEGLHPARAALEYHIINGKPSLKADAMLARFQSAGGKVDWKDYTDTKVVGVFSHPSGGSVTVEWSIEMATKIGLLKNPTWKQYPRQMLRARCISEGIRTVFPGVISGLYTPEEVQDFAPPERDVTPGAHSVPAPMPESVKAAAKAVSKPKPQAKPPIDSTATTVADDQFPPEAGDLSDAFDQPDVPMSDETKSAIIAAFAKLGFTEDMLAEEYGKPIAEWVEDDKDELREVLKAKRIEAAQAAQGNGAEI